ncbi:MAG: imelysin family protein [Flavobacteriales bacterium]|nr:imelysin family protein [Flavobacteriales bacterium]
MTLNHFKVSLFTGLLCLVILSGCDPDGMDSEIDFDRSAYLQHLGDEIIVSEYAQMVELSAELHVACDQLISDPSESQVILTREQLKRTYLQWQRVAFFDFGPASNRALSQTVNSYPTDGDKIELAISEENWIPGTPVTLDNIGLPALDYLLNANESAAGTAQEMADNPLRGAHASRIAEYLNAEVSSVHATWTGNYLDSFKASDGVEMGSSMGEVLNAFNRVFEADVRKNKLGLPSGISTFTQTPRPGLVEAVYASNWSVDLMFEAMVMADLIYHGNAKTANSAELGLDDYLNAYGDFEYGAGLNNDIETQLDIALQSVLSLQDPLSLYVTTNQQEAFDVYADLQALVVLWKVDMMSSLGILITYQDNDGD